MDINNLKEDVNEWLKQNKKSHRFNPKVFVSQDLELYKSLYISLGSFKSLYDYLKDKNIYTRTYSNFLKTIVPLLRSELSRNLSNHKTNQHHIKTEKPIIDNDVKKEKTETHNQTPQHELKVNIRTNKIEIEEKGKVIPHNPVLNEERRAKMVKKG